jgi:predicted O-methyltransferase YrrM
VRRFATALLAAPLLLASPAGPIRAQEADSLQAARGYRFTMDWFTHAIPTWEEVLGPLSGRPDFRYLEIGVYEGRSLLWMLDNVLTHPSSRATGIDPFLEKKSEGIFRANLEQSGHAERVTVIVGYSQVELRKLPLNSFDVVYIDGSHTADDVLSDATSSFDLLRIGGLMIFDDYRWTGTQRGRTPLPPELRPQVAINAFVTAYRNRVEVVHRGYQLMLRKRESPCPEKWDCSPIGLYVYVWEERELLVGGSGEEVPLTSAQRDLVERIAHSKRFGQTGFNIHESLSSKPGYAELVKQLGLELE